MIWYVRPSPRAARRCGGKRVTSRPKSVIRPSLGGSSPLIRLKSVVFPAPLGPMMARRSPGRTSRLTPSTARRPPKARDTPDSVSAESAVSIRMGRREARPPVDVLAMLARRMIPVVHRLLQERVRRVLPELGHAGKVWITVFHSSPSRFSTLRT